MTVITDTNLASNYEELLEPFIGNIFKHKERYLITISYGGVEKQIHC